MTNPIHSGPRVVHHFDADGVGRCEAPEDDALRSELDDSGEDATGDGPDCGRKAVVASAVCLGGAAGTFAMSSVGGPVGGVVAALAAAVECGLLVDDVITCYEKE